MNAFSSLSNISLVDFRSNPFCTPFIIDSLLNAGCVTLSDASRVTEKDVMSIRGLGASKIAQLMSFRDLLVANQAAVIGYYDSYIRTHVIGESEGGMPYSRISTMLTELCSRLEEAGSHNLAVICMENLLKNRSVTDIHADASLGFRLTRERIRQMSVGLREAILRNDLMKYRVVIDESLLDVISFLRCSCAGRTTQNLQEALGSGSGHLFTNLLGLTVVRCRGSHMTSLSEDYVIPSDVNVSDFMDDMDSVIEQLHADIRPSSLEDIARRAARRRPSLDEDKVAYILSSNTLCERVSGKWQLRYSGLCDYEKAARIVWERKTVLRDDVDMYHAIKTGEARQISGSLGTAGSKYAWCRPIGRTSRWEYREDGTSRENVSDVIERYVSSHDVFRFTDALSYFRSLGFSYPERTVRAYIMNICRSSIMDSDLLCAESKVGMHPETTWRRRHTPISFEWAYPVISDYLEMNGPSRVCDLVRAIMEADRDGEYNPRSAENFIYHTLREGEALLRNEDGLVSTNPSYSRKENVLPAHYQAVLSVVKSRVMESPEGMCSLRSLKDACEKIIAPFAQSTLFYKIMSEHCPEDLTRVYVDGKAYLRLCA